MPYAGNDWTRNFIGSKDYVPPSQRTARTTTAPKLPFLPPRPVVSTPQSRTSTVPARTLEHTATPRRESEATVAGDGSVLRVLYGQVQIGADVATVVTSGSYMYLLCIWGEGPIDGYDSVTVEGLDSSFLTVTSYTGTTGQTADPWLVAAIPGYADALPGIAYSVVRVLMDGLSGFPRPIARLRGRKVYDPRRDPSHPDYSGTGSQSLGNSATWEYSTNPALMLADFKSSSVYGCGWTVDWASVADAADANDETMSGGGKRRTAGIAVDTPARIEDHLDTLRAYAGCWIVRRGATAYLVPDRPGSVARSLSTSQFRDLSITVGSLTGRQRPNAVTVVYTDTSSDTWRDAEATAKSPDLVAGTVQIVEDIIRLPGVQSYNVAYREAVERLNRHLLLNLRLSFLARDDALADEVGDIVAVTDLYGLSAKQVRLTRVEQLGGGDFSVEAEEYQPNVYSDDVESDPVYTDTALRLPSDIPALTGLSLAEQVYRRTDGIWDTRIRVTWDAITDYPYRHSYRVEIQADGSPVGALSVPDTQADIASPIEGATYSITVYAANPSGDQGGSQTSQIVPLGEGIPPTDVPQMTVTRVAADAVLARWLPAVDIGVLKYELRQGASWDSAVFVDELTALERRIDGLSGSGTLLVKARDSRGNYSVNATSAAFSISAPPDPLSLSGFEAGGEIFLTVTPPDTGYVARFEWRYGPTSGFSWTGATVIDVTDTRRLTSKAIPAGTWRFAVKSVDDAGQQSSGYISRDITVTTDASAFLAADQPLTPNLGSSTNMHQLANPWGRSVETYYTNMGGTVASLWPSAMSTYTNVLATYHASGTSELLTTAHDFGITINGNWSLDSDVSEISGDGADIQLEVSTNGSTWTQVGTAAKTAGRYARARIGGATVDTLIVSVPDLSVRLDAVPREEQNTSSYATGKYAWELDGTGDYATAAHTSGLDQIDDFTIECWIRVDDWLAAGTVGIVVKGTVASDSTYYLRKLAGVDSIALSTRGSATEFNSVTITALSTLYPAGRWFHLAAVQDTTAGKLHLYTNGVLRNSGNINYTPIGNTSSVYVGSRGGSDPLTGALRDVRIWSTARTQSQIQANLTADLTLPQTGLIRNWLLVNDYTDTQGGGGLTASGDPQFIPQGQRVFLTNTYAAAQSVTITPTGSVFRAAVPDNISPGEGVSFFDAFLFDSDGNLANGNFMWFWKGV